MSQPDSQALIDAFLEGVRMKRMDHCESILAEFDALAATQPDLQPWGIYLAGILANERDHDPAEAERLFLGVLRNHLPRLELAARLHLAR